MENMIEVKSLRKNFNSTTAVNNVSFTVEKGEIFGFLGPNGAGKTTTIRILTGVLIPDSGNVHIQGIDIRRNPIEAKMKMGVIPEMSNIYIDLTAKQNIILAGRFYGMNKKETGKRADNLLQKFSLYEKKDTLVKYFSKGMRQKVSVACALVHNPEILFLDEPTLGLDIQSQRLIRNIILEMKKSGTTIFLTTHNIEEANLLCERIGIINKGRIAAIDTPERLKRIFEETQSIEISFNKLVDEVKIEKLALIERIEKLGDKFKLYTSDPDKLIKNLVDFARKENLNFTSLNICGTNLEDVFLKLVGDK